MSKDNLDVQDRWRNTQLGISTARGLGLLDSECCIVVEDFLFEIKEDRVLYFIFQILRGILFAKLNVNDMP